MHYMTTAKKCPESAPVHLLQHAEYSILPKASFHPRGQLKLITVHLML